METDILQRAIRQTKVVSFYYQCEDSPRFQIVEPHHMERRNGELVLTAWRLDEWSPGSKGWAEYPLTKVGQVTVLPNKFERRDAMIPASVAQTSRPVLLTA